MESTNNENFLNLSISHLSLFLSLVLLANDELRRKMYGCILIVGGGMKFIGSGKWLHNRIGLQIPYLYRSEQLDIVTSPKDMDSDITAWKGGAVMSCLVSHICVAENNLEDTKAFLKTHHESALETKKKTSHEYCQCKK